MIYVIYQKNVKFFNILKLNTNLNTLEIIIHIIIS